MKLSLYSSAVWKHPFGLLKLVEWASEFGYDAIGIRGVSFDVPTDLAPRHIYAFGYDMIGPKFVSEKGRRELKETIESHGLFVSELSVYTPLSVPDDSIRRECLKILHEYVDFAVDLGVKRLRPIGVNGKWALNHGISRDEAFNLVVKSLREVIPHLADVGLRMLIETVEDGITNTAENCLRMLDVLNSELLGVALDPVNLYLDDQDIEESIKLLGDYIDIVHSKNVVRTKQTEDTFNIGRYGYKWASISKGDLDWVKILHELRSVGFDGEILYEYVNPFKGMKRNYWKAIPEPEGWIRENAVYMKKILSKM